MSVVPLDAPSQEHLAGSGCVPCERLRRQSQEAKASCQGTVELHTPQDLNFVTADLL